MATAHLIHGFVGAGKTTLAKKLQNELKAVRFTPDEWMIALHGDNPPAEHFADYKQKITDLIWSVAEQVLKPGLILFSILGFGDVCHETRHDHDLKSWASKLNFTIYNAMMENLFDAS